MELWIQEHHWKLTCPKNPCTLGWKGLNLHSRGPGPQNSYFWGVRILRDGTQKWRFGRWFPFSKRWLTQVLTVNFPGCWSPKNPGLLLQSCSKDGIGTLNPIQGGVCGNLYTPWNQHIWKSMVGSWNFLLGWPICACKKTQPQKAKKKRSYLHEGMIFMEASIALFFTAVFHNRFSEVKKKSPKIAPSTRSSVNAGVYTSCI